MGILALPPSGIITDNDGIVIGRSSDGKGYLLTGGTEGQVPVIQGDGTIAYGAAGASSLSELDDWAANTLTVPGALTVRQAGGVAGTDEVQIYHDGTDGYIVNKSGNTYLGSVATPGAYNYLHEGTAESYIIKHLGIQYGSGFNGIKYDSWDKVNIHTQGDVRLIVKKNLVQLFPLEFGWGTTAGSTTTTIKGYDSTSMTPGDLLIRGPRNVNNTDGAGGNLILAGGMPTGAGTPGQVQFQIAPAGASGTTLGTLTTVGLFDEQGLTVRQPGGVAGTDEVQIYHDGTDAHIIPQSGNLDLNGYAVGTHNTDGLAFYRSDGADDFHFASTSSNGSRGFHVQGTGTVTIGNKGGSAWYDFEMKGGGLYLNSNNKYIQILSGYLAWDTAKTLLISEGDGRNGHSNGQGRIAITTTVDSPSFLAELTMSGYNSMNLSVAVEGTLIARQDGGVSGTDEIQIYHDGTHGYIDNQSGNLYLRSGGDSVYLEETNGGDIVRFRRAGVTWYMYSKGSDLLFASSNGDSVNCYQRMDFEQGFTLGELSADPDAPSEGESVFWQSDGTGSGDDGDIMVKITAGGVTKTATIIDFSTV